ncbi:MAG: transcription antitermination factor NusB [Pseudomonadota bacterium]
MRKPHSGGPREKSATKGRPPSKGGFNKGGFNKARAGGSRDGARSAPPPTAATASTDAIGAGAAPRQAALDVLALVRAGASLDEALADCRRFDALEGADRAFARALASTVLRRQGALDHVLGDFIDRPLPKRAARAMDALRLAAAQSLLFDTPDHAAVSTATALAKAYRETQGYAGLVNAVARKVARAPKTRLATLPARVDTPAWLWRSWERAYGPATARAIAAAHTAAAPTDLTPRDPAAAPAFAEAFGGRVLFGRTVRLDPRTDVKALDGFESGGFWVQDAAASLPARLLGDVAGKRVFDLCAAPGGKTMQLAAAGAHVIAVDADGTRLKRVRENLDRTGLDAETVKADVRRFAPDAPADAILLDAPCTATGTIRRHPDILRNRTADDVATLARVQAELLDKAWALLKPGGVLVFATCSIQPEEGAAQIDAATARLANARRVPVTPGEIDVPEALVSAAGDLRTLPSHLAGDGGIDGFFAARLVKEE